jgi:hypothetical protein
VKKRSIEMGIEASKFLKDVKEMKPTTPDERKRRLELAESGHIAAASASALSAKYNSLLSSLEDKRKIAADLSLKASQAKESEEDLLSSIF